MAALRLELQVRIAWWWWVYAHGVAIMSALSGLEPDWERVRRVTFRATRVRVPSGRWISFGKLLGL